MAKSTISNDPVHDQDKFMLRLPQGMRDRVKLQAEKNNRSMNAEIVARLEATEQGNLPDISAIGFAALIKQMEAIVGSGFDLIFDLRDTLPGIESFMREHDIDRQEAVRRILSDWLASNGYVKKSPDA